MRFFIALLAFALITLVISSPLPDKQSSNDKDSDKNGESSSKSSSSNSNSSPSTSTSTSSGSSSDSGSSSSSSTSDNSNTSAQKQSNDTASASQGGASILSNLTYSELQISDGKAGNAEKEAAAKFKGLDTGDLSKVSDADLKIIQGMHDTAEKAEVEAFNPAIAKASGDEAQALQNGKIKNKVLKISAAVLALEVKQAKGQTIDADKLTKEKAKKAKNIKLDVAANGQASKSVTLNASN